MPVVVITLGLPESPRWLIQNGREDEAALVMANIWGTTENDAYVQSEKKAIIEAVEIERAANFHWKTIFKRDALQTGYRIFLACLILFMNQVSFPLMLWKS